MVEDIGKRIRELRIARGLTRESFCEDGARLSTRQLARIEDGQSSPTWDKLQFIAERLGMSLSEIAGENLVREEILSAEYLELKNKIIKLPTYGDPERVAKREEMLELVYERYYDTLPEEEQLAIEILQSEFNVLSSENGTFGEGVVEDYMSQTLKKERFTVNDMLIINLYQLSISTGGTEMDVDLNQVVEKLLSQVSFLEFSQLYFVKKVLLGYAGVIIFKKEYEKMGYVCQSLREIVTNLQDFQHVPVIDMLEAKYYLFVKDDFDTFNSRYERAIFSAQMFADAMLEKRLRETRAEDIQEWKSGR